MSKTVIWLAMVATWSIAGISEPDSSVTSAWTKLVPVHGFSTPQAADGRLLVLDKDGGLVSVSLQNGALHPLCPTIPDATFLTVDGTRALVGSPSGVLLAISMETNKQLWKLVVPGPVTASPAVSGGRVYCPVGGQHPAVISCELLTGSDKQVYTTESPVLCSPLITGAKMTCALSTGQIVNVSLRTGRITASFQTSGEFTGQTPVRAGQNLLIAPGGYYRGVTAISTDLGKSNWHISYVRPFYAPDDYLERMQHMRPGQFERVSSDLAASLRKQSQSSLPGPSSFVPAGPVHTSAWSTHLSEAAVVVKEPGFAGDALYHLLVVKHQSGETVFNLDAAGRDRPGLRLPPPVFAGEYVAATLEPGNLYLCDRENGEVVFSTSVEGTIDWICISNGLLLAKTDRDSLMAFQIPFRAALPTVFKLWQNTPNPFRGATQLRFVLPRLSRAQLMIVTPQGRIVKSLVQGRWDAGYHSVIWDGSNDRGAPATAGLYLARFKAGTYTKTIKMTLVR